MLHFPGDYDDSGFFDSDDEGTAANNIHASAETKTDTISGKKSQKPDLPLLKVTSILYCHYEWPWVHWRPRASVKKFDPEHKCSFVDNTPLQLRTAKTPTAIDRVRRSQNVLDIITAHNTTHTCTHWIYTHICTYSHWIYAHMCTHSHTLNIHSYTHLYAHNAYMHTLTDS